MECDLEEVCAEFICSIFNCGIILCLQSVLRKKIVQVEQLQLQMTHKNLPTEDADSSSPAFFFLRATPDPVPSPSSLEEATAVLAGCFELGTVDCGHPLQSLSQTLTHLYVPMLTIAGIPLYIWTP